MPKKKTKTKLNSPARSSAQTETMAQTQYVERVMPQISLDDFENRIEKITTELIDTAGNVGFSKLVDQVFPKGRSNLCS